MLMMRFRWRCVNSCCQRLSRTQKRKEVIFMQRHISHIAKQRISDFFTQEDGNVGRKNALTVGTILSSVVLASTLIPSQTANADDCSAGEYQCGGDAEFNDCCAPGQYCCSDWDVLLCGGDGGGITWFYFCTDDPCPPQNVPWW